MTCDDLRLGGTLTSAGITGGTSINSTALMVANWSSVLGSAGISGQLQTVNGRPGGFFSGDLLGRERYPILNMRVTRSGPNGVGSLVEADERRQLQANTDDFLALVSDPAGQYLEIDMPDGLSRFLFVRQFDPAPIRQPRRDRTLSVPLVSSYAYWREGGQEDTQTISGSDVMVVGGNREVHDLVLVFSGDGTFTHDDLGWAIQVTGSGGPVTVDLGNRTVTEGGSDAPNRIRRTPATGFKSWGWLVPNTMNNVTSTVSVDVSWRNVYA